MSVLFIKELASDFSLNFDVLIAAYVSFFFVFHAGLLDKLLDRLSVVTNCVAHESLVNPFCPIELRKHQPAEQDQPDIRPQRNQVENEGGECVQEVEQPKDHPVREPVLVVVLSFALDGTDAMNSRVKYCQKDHKDLPALEEHQNQPKKGQYSREDKASVDADLIGQLHERTHLVTVRVQNCRHFLQLLFDLVSH